MITNITVEVEVRELLTSLGLTDIPLGCELKMLDTVEIRAVADEDDLADPFPDDDDALQPDQTAVMELVAAIRRGDAEAAELALDRLFEGSLAVREWVQQTHSSCRAVGQKEAPTT